MSKPDPIPLVLSRAELLEKLIDAEAKGFARAVEMLRQTGNDELADLLVRAWTAAKGG